MENEVVVFINGVKLEKLSSVSVQYRLVPELSGCTVSMVDEGGMYIKGDIRGGMDVGERGILEDLVSALDDRGLSPDYSVPVFKDNDIIAIFEKREGVYWWLFHGFVTTVTLGDSTSGAKKITLGCESGLKHLRHNYIVMNSYRVPGEFDESVFENEVKRIMSVYQSPDMVNMPYWKKIAKLFAPEGEATADSAFSEGEGDYSYTEHLLVSSNNIWDYMTSLHNLNNTGLSKEADLLNYVELNMSPVENKAIHVVKIGASDIFKQLEDTVFASYSFNPPIYTPKLDILNKILQPIGFVAYTLPVGDIVVEPLLNGMIGGRDWISAIDVTQLSYSFSGSAIGTVALTRHAPKIEGQTDTANQYGSWRNDTVELDADAVKAYGVRLLSADEMKLSARSEDAAKLYGKFLLARSWSNAKSASITAKYRGRGAVNRPMYVQKLDAWFLQTNVSVDYDPSGKMSGTYNLGFGLMWNGIDWSVDVLQAYSQLQLLFDMGNLLDTKDKYIAPQIEILKSEGLSTAGFTVEQTASTLRYDPSEYFEKEV